MPIDPATYKSLGIAPTKVEEVPTEYPCVKALLCGLNKAAQAALKSALSVIIAQLSTVIAGLLAQLAILDILLLPLNVTKTVVIGLVQELKSLLNIIPLNLVKDCAPFGLSIDGINLTIDQKVAEGEKLVQKVNRHLALRNELQAIVAEAQFYVQLYSQMIDIMDKRCIDDTGNQG